MTRRPMMQIVAALTASRGKDSRYIRSISGNTMVRYANASQANGRQFLTDDWLSISRADPLIVQKNVPWNEYGVFVLERISR